MGRNGRVALLACPAVVGGCTIVRHGTRRATSQPSSTLQRSAPLPSVDLLMLSSASTTDQRCLAGRAQPEYRPGHGRPGLPAGCLPLHARARASDRLPLGRREGNRAFASGNQMARFLSNQATVDCVKGRGAEKADNPTTTGRGNISVLAGTPGLPAKAHRGESGAVDHRLSSLESGSARCLRGGHRLAVVKCERLQGGRSSVRLPAAGGSRIAGGVRLPRRRLNLPSALLDKPAVAPGD